MSKDSARTGRWHEQTVVWMGSLDEAGASAYFNTSQGKTDTPTKQFATFKYPSTLHQGLINRIHYRLNPDNAVTYTLRLWQTATAANYASNRDMLYESPSGQVDDTDYDRAELNVPFILEGPGIMYYSIEYSAAQGSCVAGFIYVSGEVLK